MSMEVWATKGNAGNRRLHYAEPHLGKFDICRHREWASDTWTSQKEVLAMVPQAVWDSMIGPQRMRLVLPDAIDPAKTIEVGDTVRTPGGHEWRVSRVATPTQCEVRVEVENHGCRGMYNLTALTLLTKAGEPEPEPVPKACRHCDADAEWHQPVAPRLGVWRVFCPCCKQSGPTRVFKTEAIEAWNLQNGA